MLGFDPDAPGSASIWFTAFGGRLYGDDGAPMLDDPKNVEALDWMKQVLDAQGGYAKVKSFKDSMDVFGKNNQYVADQVGVQTWAQWYPNVLARHGEQGVPRRGSDQDHLGQDSGHGRWNVLCHPQVREEPRGRLRLGDRGHVDGRVAGGREGEGGDGREEPDSIATGLMTGSPVADKAVREQYVKPSGNADFDQVIKTYYAVLPDNSSFGASPVGQQVKQELDNAVVVALTGEKTPQQALADAQTAAQRAWDQVKK